MKSDKDLQKTANKIARSNGMGRATSFRISDNFVNISHVESKVDFGYRKYTTGEYVSNAYRSKFGWKNTYYQKAKCCVLISIQDAT